MTSPTPVAVVLTPDAFGHALLESDAAEVLVAWRDQQIRLVVDRDLILRYLRLLRQLALPERLLRWWGWWLGSPEKAMILPDAPIASSGAEHYRHLATASGAAFIVHWPGLMPAGLDAGASVNHRWITVQELVRGIRSAPPDPAGSAAPSLNE
jgi:hypothetical protein